MYAAYADGTVCVVISFDNRGPKDSLDTYIKEFAQYPVFRYGMTFERDVMLLGFSGKQYRVKSPNAEGIVQFYLTKTHAYIFEAVSDDITKPAVNQFLSAITSGGDKTKGTNGPERISKSVKSVSPVSSAVVTSDVPTNPIIDPNSVLKSNQVMRKFVVVTMPIPGYTEEARQHQTSGRVRVRTVFSSSGKVINISPIDMLPFGLTEKAIEAVQRIKFIPSVKDGKYVSTYATLELTFNIY